MYCSRQKELVVHFVLTINTVGLSSSVSSTCSVTDHLFNFSRLPYRK